MFTNDEFATVLEGVDLLITERKELRAEGPHFLIVHRLRMPGTHCAPGEEVFAILLVYRGREYQLRLPLSLRLLFDYLTSHSRLAQSAAQIELGMRAGAFYSEHAANAGGRTQLTRRIPRSSIKEYIKRLRRAFALAFREAGLRIDPQSVLIAEHTVSNQVGYRLRATVDLVHIDLSTLKN